MSNKLFHFEITFAIRNEAIQKQQFSSQFKIKTQKCSLLCSSVVSETFLDRVNIQFLMVLEIIRKYSRDSAIIDINGDC